MRETMNVFYNDNEPYCCNVLRARIADGSLPDGHVSQQDVRAVQPEQLIGYRHIHLFAGIGGFPLGFKWAGWPEWLSIVTGGPPCQPTSVAGAQRGEADPRYLWPEMARIVQGVRPRYVLYENPTGTPELSIDRVCADLESQGYEVWPPIVFPACAIGAPHRRDRVWIVGHTLSVRGLQPQGSKPDQRRRLGNASCVTPHAYGSRRPQQVGQPECGDPPDVGYDGAQGTVADNDSIGFQGLWHRRGEGLATQLGSEAVGCSRKGHRSEWWNVEPDVGHDRRPQTA